MHTPVLLAEMLSYIVPQDGKTYLDCTFGAGGYSKAILESAKCNLIALDQDPEVAPYADRLKEEYGERFSFHLTNFANLSNVLTGSVDGVVFDLGVSNMQLKNPERGFSFASDGPLDMRMDKGTFLSTTAASLLQSLAQEELADLLYKNADEHYSRRIARAICANKEKIKTTCQLANVIRSAIGRAKRDGLDSATKAFQAIRIAVNDELAAFQTGLEAAGMALAKGGKIVVVSFHSLEDKIAKEFFRSRSLRKVARSRYATKEENVFEYEIIKKPILPSREEVLANPGARSAKLRAAIKI